ncbi:MAG: 3-phosphoshikimate 1-carboxyvinyltransferase [Opitutales bacterium]
MLPDLLPIRPFTRPVEGTVVLPGSKSLTNRALALAALTRQQVRLTGALFSDDTRVMAEALRRLGLPVEEDASGRTLTLQGVGGEWPVAEAELYYGNAGTAARFLTALLALRAGGCYTLDGNAAMRKRPMRGLFEALTHLGAAEVAYLGAPGFFPVRLRTHGFPAGAWPVDASASSQILSALLMAAPLAPGSVRLKLLGETVSRPFVQMTLHCMAQFGQTQPMLEANHANTFTFVPHAYRLAGATYPVEPDATAASYFLALPWVVGGSLTLPGFAGVRQQGDRAFADILVPLGVRVEELSSRHARVSLGERGRAGGRFDFNPISDTFLTLAALAPLLESPLTIHGIAHTRHQETDRIGAMAAELRKLGQKVDETDDSLTIEPDPAAVRKRSAHGPIEIDTYEDHRIAMSFGILGCFDLHGDGRPWIALRDPGCCAKTFPDFFQRLEDLRG